MNKKGFTLVEVLAVIVLLSVIVAIAVPAITKTRANALEKEAESQIEQIEKAAGFYARDEDTEANSVTVQELINTDYIKSNVDNGTSGCTNSAGCLFDPYGNNLNNKVVTITRNNNKITVKYQE